MDVILIKKLHEEARMHARGYPVPITFSSQNNKSLSTFFKSATSSSSSSNNK